jgi:hypothetical protein
VCFLQVHYTDHRLTILIDNFSDTLSGDVCEKENKEIEKHVISKIVHLAKAVFLFIQQQF